MTQKLFVEIADATGEKKLQEVMVIRSWQSADGVHIYLFANGNYGYRDGAPVKRVEDFGAIAAPLQRRAAENWWQRTGAAIAKSYYEALDERERRLAGDFQAAGTLSESELDAVLYYRIPAGDAAATREGPFSWLDIFQKRPDWWGQAELITMKDWTYAKVDDQARAEAAPEQKRAARK